MQVVIPWRSILDRILPTRCHGCGRYLRGDPNPCFCRDCWAGLPRFSGPACPRCGRPFASEAALSMSPSHLCGDCRDRKPHFDRAVAAGPYAGTLAEAIHLFKYRGKTVLARPLGELLLEPFGRIGRADCLLPVPLHPARLREREYNQALLLCDRVGGRVGIPVVPDLLSRTRQTPPQIGLSRLDRRRNMRRAFIVNRPDRAEGRAVVLIDDVYTTGATVNECARTLKRAGAEVVSVLTVARTTGEFVPGGPSRYNRASESLSHQE